MQSISGQSVRSEKVAQDVDRELTDRELDELIGRKVDHGPSFDPSSAARGPSTAATRTVFSAE